MINQHWHWVLHRTSHASQYLFHREWQENPEVTLYQVHLLFIVLACCSLGHDDRSTIYLWLNVHSFCSCSCAHALTASNCYYALRHQISRVPVTLLWRECLYGAIWSWILSLLLFTLAYSATVSRGSIIPTMLVGWNVGMTPNKMATSINVYITHKMAQTQS